MKIKRCPKCNVLQPVEEFQTRHRTKNGRFYLEFRPCRACESERRILYPKYYRRAA